jgi:predicted signal transduction protein with EAL and GGDEF domain
MTILIPQLAHIAPPALADEVDRLEDLYSMKILDTAADERFDQFTRLAATILDAPLAAISFVDQDRQWFKSSFGFKLRETPRDISFCAHAIAEPEILVVPDTREDRRFATNPMVIGEPEIRAYAGAVVHGPSGRPVGTCCILDLAPKKLSETECSILIQLAHAVERELKLSKGIRGLKKRLRSVAMVDPSTGLPNLTSFMTDLRRTLPQINSESEGALLALIRIERLDALEAALGRDALAYILVQVSDRTRDIIGPNCHVASTGEDKIGALIPIKNRPDAPAILESLIKSLEQPFALGDHTVRLRVSVGASIYPDDANDGQLLLKRARTALWSRPLSARSGYQLYKRKHSNTASRQFQIEAAMRSGLAENEFSLVFQPKITTTNNAIAGAEALVRWNSRTLGSVPPTEFIPIAEDSGLIMELGSWVLETVSHQLNDWHDQSIDCPSISVNITSHQLHQLRFAAQIKKLISRYGLDPSWLSLELTESTLVDDINSAVKIMQALRDVGIGIAIDDFGTGFSSLSYLQRLPIDTLKIDRSFVRRIPENRDDMKLIRSIISIGKELDLIVVAEGVETEQQLQFLQAVQCDQIQGYIYSKPLPAADFLEYVRNHPSRRVPGR